MEPRRKKGKSHSTETSPEISHIADKQPFSKGCFRERVRGPRYPKNILSFWPASERRQKKRGAGLY